jgi:cytoskeletal protein RodZ
MPASDLEQRQSGADAAHANGLGTVLCAARQAHGLTVQEASERLRIPARYLTMLEAGDYGAIADELYLLPFVRSYAEFLGLDAETLATHFLSGIQPLEKVIELEPEVAQGFDRPRGRWFTTAAVMLFVALALYLVGLK